MEPERIVPLLSELFGSGNVVQDAGLIARYSSSINGSVVRPLCVVYPSSTSSVAELAKIAGQNNFNLYPISKGKNLGYGDAQGTAGNQVIVDFSRMNQVLEVNPELCYATIQPGVTQEQLFNFLRSGN